MRAEGSCALLGFVFVQGLPLPRLVPMPLLPASILLLIREALATPF